MKIKIALLLVTSFAFLAFAQTTNTYLLFGNNCVVYGCNIQPASENDSAWGSPSQEWPPSDPHYNVGTHAYFTTGLPVRINAYPPASASGTGSGTFDWWISNRTTGSFSVDLSCTWAANGKIGNYPRFLESCVSTSTGPNGESVSFTRDWYATQGSRGSWNLFVLNMPGTNPPLVPRMNLTIAQ